MANATTPQSVSTKLALPTHDEIRTVYNTDPSRKHIEMSSHHSIEVVNPNAIRGKFRFALFDFDGTLSLIREGWQNVMIPYFVEELRKAPECEPEAEAEATVREFVEKLTGKQTIYQCMQLAEEIKLRNGTPAEALTYKRTYLDRLWNRISHRVKALENGAVEPDSFMLRGTRALLEALRDRNIMLYLASGTDIQFVKNEASALKLDEFFGSRIYGAVDQYKNFSKQMIINHILEENQLHGSELLVVGDGYVEIENGKSAGGFSLGVASNEANPGELDEWKRNRLTAAGADAIIPDYLPLEALLDYLFP